MAEVPGSVQYSSGGSMFDGIGSALTGGVLGYLAADETNRSNRQLAQYQNEQSAAEAARNREFQERMRNTSYQAAVKDMLAAGLSPMLAYSQGGAAVPSGAVGAMSQAAPAVSPIGGFLSGAETGGRYAQTRSDTSLKESQDDLARSNVDLTKAQVGNVAQQTATGKAQELAAVADAQQKSTQARLNSANEAKTRAETGFIAAQRSEVEAKSPLWNMFHSVSQKMKDISESNSAANVKRAADNARSLRFEGRNENPRSITIYGTSNR